jgi:hypothetical protein
MHWNEAQFYKRAVLRTLKGYLRRMLADGTVQLAPLYARYLARPVPEDTEQAIQDIEEFLQTTIDKHHVKDGLPMPMWAGTEELMAAVWYFREPIFVMDAWKDGRVFVQMCHLALNKHGVEHVKISALEEDAAIDIIHSMLRHRVIPIMLMLHHHEISGSFIAHFKSVRLLPQLYHDWTKPGPRGEDMCTRLQVVYGAVGMYAAPTNPPEEPSHVPVRQHGEGTAEGSEYSPSTKQRGGRSPDGDCAGDGLAADERRRTRAAVAPQPTGPSSLRPSTELGDR